MRKKAVEMSFNWLFALIVGAVILGLAIYGATKIVKTGTQVVSTESAAKLISFLEFGPCRDSSRVLFLWRVYHAVVYLWPARFAAWPCL